MACGTIWICQWNHRTCELSQKRSGRCIFLYEDERTSSALLFDFCTSFLPTSCGKGFDDEHLERWILGILQKYSQRDGSVFGFGGLQEVTGRRVLGVAHCMAASTTILLDPTVCLGVPEGWSLDEAASVPAAYVTAYIALVESPTAHRRGGSGAGRGDWSGGCS
ncbi:hypothetical protein CEXT_295651 [Caerostris extrusa]|uniref:Uncharacterized protein n=1 Tax=Caerostris extrusa TaxID=172846 RepID=A0AAV4Y8K5_CAEEX|nr:hypothetical protein CEXT_295651 [Caerostris extrusa]